MPWWASIAIAIIGGLLGTGGIAAYIRARGQNQVDVLAAVTKERESIAAERAAMTAWVQTQLSRQDEKLIRLDEREEQRRQQLQQAEETKQTLIQQNAALHTEMEHLRQDLERQSDNAQRLLLERARERERNEIEHRLKDEKIAWLESRIAELEKQLATQVKPAKQVPRERAA